MISDRKQSGANRPTQPLLRAAFLYPAKGVVLSAGVTSEQVKQAKEVDLLTYLQANEPHELLPPKNGEYRTKSHGSLVISNGCWFWNRGGFGARSALDYLMKVRGMGFVDAVETVLGARASPSFSSLPVERANSPPRAEFKLPEAAALPANVVSYLQRRGISPEVINRCLEAGILYESRKHQNAVFVGRDEHGRARFACLRGTKDDFKSDIAGSSKKYSFTYPAKNPDSRHLACFEAPLDALSHATLQQRGGWDWDGHRLSLGGTSDVSLISFLERNPQITRVILHLDSDAAGITAARKIKAELAADSRFRHIRVSVNPPRGAKDYNDALLRTISLDREQNQSHKHTRRRQADILV